MKLIEVLDGDFMVNQLRKLIAHQDGKLAVDKHGQIFTVTDLKVVNSADGKKFLKLYVLPLPTDSAFNFLVDIAKLDQWELKKDGARYILQKKPLDEGREEWPILASMLGKLVSHSFKGDGPPVNLYDTAYDARGVRVVGYRWLPSAVGVGGAGFLTVTVRGPNLNRDIIYPGSTLGDNLVLKKNGDEWQLKWLSSDDVN